MPLSPGGGLAGQRGPEGGPCQNRGYFPRGEVWRHRRPHGKGFP